MNTTNANIEINWKKYVDHIYVIDNTKTSNDRNQLISEIKRLNIYDIDLLTYFNNISTPFYKDLFNEFNTENCIDVLKKYHSGFDCTMAHYFCIKQAYELGYDHIMIIENDLCFLRNKQYIINILESCHKLYDVYDTFVLENNAQQNIELKNIYENGLTNIPICTLNDYINNLEYSNIIKTDNNFNYCDAGCNIYNRSAMSHLINYYEHMNFVAIDVYYYLFDNKNNKIAYSFPSIGFQQKAFYNYDIDIMELYTFPKFDYKYLLNSFCEMSRTLPIDLLLKRFYDYIKKYCVGYQYDEDFKLFEKLYNRNILGQEISFDDIDKDKLDI